MKRSAAEFIKGIEALFVKLISQIFAANSPMAGEHIFDTGAAGPAGIKFRFTSIDQITAT